MARLEVFINDTEFADLDPPVKMALIHYQFEAIHPFTDGNGRTGRILNILYLIHQRLLDLPVLYLSKYIIENKADYYRLLRAVTENADWQQWVLYMLKGVVETAGYTLEKIKNILALKDLTEQQIKAALGSSFSKELVALLFSYPYIKISVLTTYGIAKRQTASQYLQKIENLGVLQSIKIGRETYYINHQLMQLLSS